MIILDTHIWVWWVHKDPKLPLDCSRILSASPAHDLAVSVISCWEVAQLVSLGRLQLSVSIDDFMASALGPSGIQALPLTPEIAVESCRLPGAFHRDPADRFIVATARVLNCSLMTLDARIRAYPHVPCVP